MTTTDLNTIEWIKYRSYFGQRPFLAYTCVVVIVIAIALIQYTIPGLADSAPFLFYFPTIFFIAWFMPARASGLSIVLSLVALFTIRSRLAEGLDQLNIIRYIFYILSCSLIVWITKRTSAAESALQKNEERLQLMYLQRELAFKAANLGWYMYDVEKDATTYDEGFNKIFAIKPDCSRAEINRRIHPDDQSKVREAVAKALDPETGGLYSYEYRIVLDDGSIRWIEAHGLPTFSKGPRKKAVSLVGTVVDITERKEEALRLLKSELRYRELFEKMQETYFVVEIITNESGSPVDWCYVETNPQTELLMGLSKEQMVGKKYSDLVTSVDPKWINMLGHVALTGDPVSVEMYAPARSRWFGVNAYSPRPRQAAVLLTDIDERINTQEKLIQSKENLARALEEANKNLIVRDDFLSIASHELKTPLTALQLQLGLIERYIKVNLKEYEDKTEPLTKLILKTLKQMQRLNVLVDDLLDVSRIQKGKLSFFFEEHSITSVIHEAIEKVAPVLGEAHCHFKLDIEDNIICVCDSMRMEQIVINLLTNAAKYAPGSNVELIVTEKNDHLIIETRDNGPGIAPEYQEKIFQRFERAGAGNGVSGLGLGLFIVKSIVEGHGGHITFKSALGQGTIFIIDLPLKQS